MGCRVYTRDETTEIKASMYVWKMWGGELSKKGGELSQRDGELSQRGGEFVAENSEKRGTPKLADGDFFKTGNCHTLF